MKLIYYWSLPPLSIFMKMERLLHDLHLSKLTEESLAGLCNHICEAEDVVYQNCVALLQSTFLAKVIIREFGILPFESSVHSLTFCQCVISGTRVDRSPIANSYYFNPERVQSERQSCGGWFIVAPYPWWQYRYVNGVIRVRALNASHWRWCIYDAS